MQPVAVACNRFAEAQHGGWASWMQALGFQLPHMLTAAVLASAHLFNLLADVATALPMVVSVARAHEFLVRTMNIVRNTTVEGGHPRTLPALPFQGAPTKIPCIR